MPVVHDAKGKENAGNACSEVAFKITTDGLKRAPCVRPRCVARRQAINSFKKASSDAWLRLTLNAWKQYAGATPMERAARHFMSIHSRRTLLSGSLRRWHEAASSVRTDTAALAQQCVAAVTLALCSDGLSVEDTGATAAESQDGVPSSAPQSPQSPQSYLEYERTPQPEAEASAASAASALASTAAAAAAAAAAAEMAAEMAAEIGAYLPYEAKPPPHSCASTVSSHVMSPHQPSLPSRCSPPTHAQQTSSPRAVAPRRGLVRVDADEVVAAVSGALRKLAAIVAEEWAASGACSEEGHPPRALLRRCGATAIGVATSVSAPVTPLLQTALLRRRTAPRNLMEAYRDSGFRDM